MFIALYFRFSPTVCRQGHGAKPRVRFGTLTEVDMLEHAVTNMLKPKMQQISEFIASLYSYQNKEILRNF